MRVVCKPESIVLIVVEEASLPKKASLSKKEYGVLACALKPADGRWADAGNSLAGKREGRAVTPLGSSPKAPTGCGLVGVSGAMRGFRPKMYSGGGIVNLLKLTGLKNWGLYQRRECTKLGASPQTRVRVDVSLLPRVTQVQDLLPTILSSVKLW